MPNGENHYYVFIRFSRFLKNSHLKIVRCVTTSTRPSNYPSNYLEEIVRCVTTSARLLRLDEPEVGNGPLVVEVDGVRNLVVLNVRVHVPRCSGIRALGVWRK